MAEGLSVAVERRPLLTFNKRHSAATRAGFPQATHSASRETTQPYIDGIPSPAMPNQIVVAGAVICDSTVLVAQRRRLLVHLPLI